MKTSKEEIASLRSERLRNHDELRSASEELMENGSRLQKAMTARDEATQLSLTLNVSAPNPNSKMMTPEFLI